MITEQFLVTAKQVICALLALIMPFLGYGRPNLGAKPPAAETVRIMSFNVRNGEFDRGEIVPQVIADYLPDSVGLQECEGTWFLTMKAYLPDYEILGVDRATGIPLIGETTSIMYRKDKYKLINYGTFWISETPYIPSKGWDAKYERTCTWVILENRETGECYAHLNAHLDHVGYEARAKGVELILEKAEKFDMPVVLTGDFNFEKETEYYKTLVSGKFSDVSALALSADEGPTYHNYKGESATEKLPIDFICVNDKITSVLSYKIMRDKYNDKYVSDHYPIYSDIIF